MEYGTPQINASLYENVSNQKPLVCILRSFCNILLQMVTYVPQVELQATQNKEKQRNLYKMLYKLAWL